MSARGSKEQGVRGSLLREYPKLRDVRVSTMRLAALTVVANAVKFQFVINERFKQLKRHFLRQTALMQFQFRTHHDDRPTGVIHAFTEQVLTETTLLPFEHIGEDFRGRLFAPVITRPRRPLSNRASTDSCNIRFSLRTIISGARSSIRRFKRLLRLITRRYRSFKSDVAKRPPSKGTNGRNSGGRTGTTSRIIHSGRVPEEINASINFKRLTSFLRLVSEEQSRSSSSAFSFPASRSIAERISFHGLRTDASTEVFFAIFLLRVVVFFGQHLQWLQAVKPGSITTIVFEI
jgi:hypothetical protein